MLYLFLLLFVSLSRATKTLVFVRDLVDKTTYSQLLRDLKNRGHELTFKTATDSSAKLESYGVYNYDNLILLSPNSKKYGEAGTKQLLEFADSGRNILILVNSGPPKTMKNIASQFGVEIRSKFVMDHFHHNQMAVDSKNHTFITSKAAHPMFGKQELPIAYRGVAFTFKPKTQLGLHLLTPEDTGYNEFGVGNSLGLVSSVQLRNNARITFVGSTEFLTNEYSLTHVQVGGKVSGTGNGKFASQVSSWTFQELGKLRARNAQHFLVDKSGPVNPTRYTVKEFVRYELIIEEYDMKTRTWVPYVADDVQFQLVRLDPFVRTMMQTDGNGLYYLEFVLPDIFGIFKFQVDYKRKGKSFIFEEIQASVRPLRHDQHERFLITASPYYTSMFSMMIGFFVFGFLFVNSDTDKFEKID